MMIRWHLNFTKNIKICSWYVVSSGGGIKQNNNNNPWRQSFPTAPDGTGWAHQIPQLHFQLSKPDRYFFIQVTTQFIRSRGWVDLVIVWGTLHIHGIFVVGPTTKLLENNNKSLLQKDKNCVTMMTSFLCLYSSLWTLASLMILPQIFLSCAFFHRVSTFNNFTSFKTLSSHLNLGLPFFREPSGCEKVIFFASWVFLHSD
jgi:hypothetical protein